MNDRPGAIGDWRLGIRGWARLRHPRSTWGCEDE